MPRYTQYKRTLKYSQEFKLSAVEMSLIEGVKVGTVASRLDIHPYMLSRWRKEYREGLIVADKRKKITNRRKESKELTKLQQLERENAQLKQEVDLLKKWQRFLAEERGKDINSSID
jgi:transposase